MSAKRVFVYGTLKAGEENHRVIEKFIASVTPAAICGWLYDLGSYPAVTEGNGWVSGELVEFLLGDEDSAFHEMDRLEGVDHTAPSNGLYERVTVTAYTDDGEEITCETYRMSSHQLKSYSWSELLPSGMWPRNTDQEPILYAAYGSCMSIRSFAETVVGFRVIGRVELPGRRVAFTRYSDSRQGGVADLIEEQGASSEGILYIVPADQMAALDVREGAPFFYQRIMIPVVCEGNNFEAVTYEVCNKSLVEIAPHPDYAQLIIDGAVSLSSGYAESLRAHMTALQERVSR